VNPFRLSAATGDVVARLDSVDGASVETTIVLRQSVRSTEDHLDSSSGNLSPRENVDWHGLY
jgi:hypothetical protein